MLIISSQFFKDDVKIVSFFTSEILQSKHYDNLQLAVLAPVTIMIYLFSDFECCSTAALLYKAKAVNFTNFIATKNSGSSEGTKFFGLHI